MNRHFGGACSLSSAQFASQVEATLANHFGPSSAPWRATLVSSQTSHGGTLVFSVLSTQTGQSVAAKVYKRRHLAEAEFRAVHEARTGKAKIAPVLFADAGTGISISDWQEGKNFSNLFEEDWEDAATKAGMWLRELHTGGRKRVRPYHPMRFLVELCDAANAMAGAILPQERIEYTRALSATARAAATSLPGVFAPVRLHGDFLPQNLILTPDGAVGIDLLHTRIGARYDDLASMTVHLALRAKIGTLGTAPSAEDVRQAFLASYGLIGRLAHSRLRLAERVELLKRWQHLANESFPDRKNGLAMVRAIQSIFHEQGWRHRI